MKNKTITEERWIVTFGGKSDRDRQATGFSNEEDANEFHYEQIQMGRYANIFFQTVVTTVKKVV